MLSPLSGAAPNVIAFEAVGEVTATDYDQVLMPAVEQAIADHGEVRVVVELGTRFTGYSAGAVWRDSKVGLGHMNRWRRAAIVTDRDWIRHATQAFAPFMPGQVRVFPIAQEADALTWAAE